MKKWKIGVLCPSEIAFRRFMPALQKIETAQFVGIAHADEEEWFGCVDPAHDLSVLQADGEKANAFVNAYGGKVFDSFKALISDTEVEAVYIPLPPALHFKWAKLALENGKHVLVEKPSTTVADDTKALTDLADKNGLALHENYMFNFHSQLDYIEDVVQKGVLGDVRLYSIKFGFPFRGAKDFRYSKKMGGGALLDCGGYTLKLATRLLGDGAKLVAHTLNYKEGFEVDIYGSGTLVNDAGVVAQIAFGMDNAYKCELEVWGAKATLYTGRVLTAPEGFTPSVQIKDNEGVKEYVLDADDSFKKSIEHFIRCIEEESVRKQTYANLIKQALLVDAFKEV